MLLSPVIELETRKAWRLNKGRWVKGGWIALATLVLWLDSLHREGVSGFDALAVLECSPSSIFFPRLPEKPVTRSPARNGTER